MKIPLHFEQVTREADVKFFTGFDKTEIFKFVFEHLSEKASHMNYWLGKINTVKDKMDESVDPSRYTVPTLKPGPKRKLSLEQEFFLVMLRLRLGLFLQDLAFRFDTSKSQVSSIFTTWIKLTLLSRPVRHIGHF